MVLPIFEVRLDTPDTMESNFLSTIVSDTVLIVSDTVSMPVCSFFTANENMPDATDFLGCGGGLL